MTKYGIFTEIAVTDERLGELGVTAGNLTDLFYVVRDGWKQRFGESFRVIAAESRRKGCINVQLIPQGSHGEFNWEGIAETFATVVDLYIHNLQIDPEYHFSVFKTGLLSTIDQVIDATVSEVKVPVTNILKYSGAVKTNLAVSM